MYKKLELQQNDIIYLSHLKEREREREEEEEEEEEEKKVTVTLTDIWHTEYNNTRANVQMHSVIILLLF